MLGDKDINKIINAVKEYNDLLQKSSVVMDRLAETKKQWDTLLSDRDELRAESERMNRFIAQFKEDYQNFHAREPTHSGYRWAMDQILNYDHLENIERMFSPQEILNVLPYSFWSQGIHHDYPSKLLRPL